MKLKFPDCVHFFGPWARQAVIETIAVVYELTKGTQEKLFADWGQWYKAFFVPNQDPASAWIFGNSSVRVGTQGLFHQYLKTFVPPFLLTRLTAPGSPRMCLIKTSLCTLYYSLVYPYWVFGAQLVSQTLIKRLINLQKRVIRIVSRNSFDAHANPIFVSLWILKFEDTIKLQIAGFAHTLKVLKNPWNLK